MNLSEDECEMVCEAYRDARHVADLANALLLAVDTVLGLAGHEVLKHLAEGRAMEFLATETSSRADVLGEKMRGLYDLANAVGVHSSVASVLPTANGATEH